MPTRQVVAVIAAGLIAALVAGCASAPTALSPDEIVAAFSAENQDEARTFHMEWQGTMGTTPIGPDAPVGQVITASLSASFDFSGHDFAGTMTTGSATGGSGPNASTLAYARVGGVMFTRYPESGWQRTDGLGLPQPSFDPLQGLAAADVAYEASETLDGSVLHRLRILDPAAALARTLFSNAAGNVELTSDSAEYLLYVDGRGVPVRAHLAFDGQISTGLPGEPSGPGTAYRMAFEYQFSAWDEEFFIRSPV